MYIFLRILLISVGYPADIAWYPTIATQLPNLLPTFTDTYLIIIKYYYYDIEVASRACRYLSTPLFLLVKLPVSLLRP